MIVRGKDVNVFIELSGVYKLAACATTCSSSRTAEKINITTANSGRENEYEGGATDNIITLSGAGTLDEVTAWQFEDWVAAMGTKVNIRLDYTNPYGDRLRYEMAALIDDVNDQGDVNDFWLFDVSMTRSGAETMTKIFDNILVDGIGNPILDGGGNLIRV